MKKTILSFLLLTILLSLSAQSGYIISKPEPTFSNNILKIKYNITGCKRGEFVDIILILLNAKGDTLRPQNITGDIGKMISCGLNKSIEWNLEKDKIKLDEDTEVFIKGVKSIPASPEKLTRGNIVLSSLLVPGLGQKKAKGNSKYLFLGALGYGSLCTSVYFSLRSRDNKVKYNNASGSSGDQIFEEWQKSYDLSKYFAYGAAGVWAVNMIWSAIVPIQISPDKNLKVRLDTFSGNSLVLSAKWTF